MKKLLELGSVIVNILVRSKLSGDARDNFIDIVSMLKEFGIDEFEARGINRNFEKIADNISMSCKKILENTKIHSGRSDIIVKNVICAYNHMNLDISALLDLQADEEKIKQKLIEANKGYTDDLDPREQELYERLLEHTSHLITNAYIKLPDFDREGIKRLNVKIDEIVDKIDDLISQMEKVNALVVEKEKKVSNFERHYRNSIISQNNYVYLFGAGGLTSEYKRYQLSIAYVELEMFDEFSGREIKLDRMFAKSKNIWLSGEAGLGKTTLLQWIAVKAAENDTDIEGIRDTIPILIHLRKYNCDKISLPECIRNVMKDSSYGMPEGWIEELTGSGRLLFLIDGFDEVSEDDRNKVLLWMESIDSKGKCKKVFTARPQVKERPKAPDLLEVKILPMNRMRIKKFINYWHNAVLEEQLKIDVGDASKVAEGLYEKIRLSDALSKLASIPLLCAMICALHYRNELNLPNNKRELYEECCKMLIEKRDAERKIALDTVKLSYEQKKIILAQLAYWMMKNNYVEASTEDAKGVVKRSISGMNIVYEDAIEYRIFKYLLERCGILREPEQGKVDFVHRTFQEYLAACEISREEDWGVVEEKIGNTLWQETIGVCIGYAKKEVASRIIRETLRRGAQKGEEKKYLFLAVSYLNGAVEVEEGLREHIQTEISSLIPPRPDECQKIAEAGDLAVPYLSNKKSYNANERLACLRVLWMIGTSKTLAISKSYFDRELTIEELRELGNLYAQFTIKEHIENDIPKALFKYIWSVCGTKVILHSEMLRLINVLPHKAFDFLASKPIGQLEIIDYENQIPIKKDRVFHNVKSLCIYGNFTRDSIMQNFIHLQSLFLCNTSNDFQIYNLRKYRNLYGIREFTFITCAVHYINGKDLEFLAECERLELILTHYNSELEFEQFDLLNSLKELKIGAGFVSELDFNDLPKELELLTLAVPGEEVQYAKQMAVRGGYGRAKKTVIENYHDLLRGLENKVGNSIWGT